MQVLNSNESICEAVKFARPFRIHPSLANLTIDEASSSLFFGWRSFEVLADALKNAQGIKSISIKLSNPHPINQKTLERAIISVIDALKANVNLTSAKFQIDFRTDDIIEAIGRFLKECHSIKKVDLSEMRILREYLHCGMIAEGLASSKSLEKLDLGMEPFEENKPPRFSDNLNILTEALMQNNSVANHFWEVDRNGRSLKRVLIIERKRAETQLNVANANSPKIAPTLYKQISLAQSSVKKCKEYLASSTEEFTQLGKSIKDLIKQNQVLEEERNQLQARINAIDVKREEIIKTLKKNSTQFNHIKTEREMANQNVQKYQQFLMSKKSDIQKWQQKLQSDLRTWTVEDVIFFLTEAELSQYCQKFKQNNINGTIFLALDTNDLMAMLDVSFKDAKKILMYKYLAQTAHDIYVIPKGPLKWTNEFVGIWLEKCQLSHLKHIFKLHQITGVELLFLEKADLINHLQIRAIGDVIKLQDEILKLKDSLKDDRMVVDEGNNNNNQMNVKLVPPAAFICPITQDIMKDPVVASDGHTYERTAIEQWLKTKNTSPMTGLQLANKQLTPSHTLKSMIKEFVDTNK